MRTQLDQRQGFLALGGGEIGAQREADHHTHGHTASHHDGVRQRHPPGIDHGARKPQAGRLLTQLYHLLPGRFRLQQSVIENRSQRRCVRQGRRGKAGDVEVSRGVIDIRLQHFGHGTGSLLTG